MDIAKREQLLTILRKMTPAIRQRLEEIKADGVAQADRHDYLWYFLLQSFSTMGNSRGYQGLMKVPERLAKVSFDALSPLTPKAREQVLAQTLAAAKVLIVQQLGGLAGARAAAFAQPGTAAKIAFMKQFAGIGDKYAPGRFQAYEQSDVGCVCHLNVTAGRRGALTAETRYAS